MSYSWYYVNITNKNVKHTIKINKQKIKIIANKLYEESIKNIKSDIPSVYFSQVKLRGDKNLVKL